MDERAMNPFGQSLRDFYNGDRRAACVVRREDGYVGDLPAAPFFREASEFSTIERTAIDLCRGRVLDIGAGVGCHSLALQMRGLDVLAIDVNQNAIDILMSRGVKHVQRIDVFDVRDGKFDTLLMLMHGIGLTQNLAGLDRFLRQAQRLARPGGQILADSLDVRRANEPEHLAYQAAHRRAGRYVGEVRLRFEYKGLRGPLFGWLHVDPETLTEHAKRAGWSCEVVCQTDDGDYLAKMTLLASTG